MATAAALLNAGSLISSGAAEDHLQNLGGGGGGTVFLFGNLTADVVTTLTLDVSIPVLESNIVSVTSVRMSVVTKEMDINTMLDSEVTC